MDEDHSGFTEACVMLFCVVRVGGEDKRERHRESKLGVKNPT